MGDQGGHVLCLGHRLDLLDGRGHWTYWVRDIF